MATNTKHQESEGSMKFEEQSSAIKTPAVQYDTTVRCDRCGAQAVGEAWLSSGTLYFCGHHGRQYLPALASQGVKVYGEFALGVQY